MSRVKRVLALAREYPAVTAIVALILAGIVLQVAGREDVGRWFSLAAIVIGGGPLLRANLMALRQGRYALDYIALLAIGLAVLTGNMLVGAVIALMVAGGQ